MTRSRARCKDAGSPPPRVGAGTGRRRMLAACAMVALLAMTPATAWAGSETSAPRAPHLSLPPLTGTHPLGTVAVRLVDRSRPDPSFPSGHRELMVQLWYPAAATHGFLPASYMPAKTAAYVEHPAGLPAGTISRIVVHAAQGAPAAPGAHPVLLYSPGSGDMRSASTTLVENMASEGYVVVAIDHTHEANVVEFPGGQLVRGTFADTGPASNTRALTVRVADTRFVLDQLAVLDRRGRFAGKLDLSRIGMFGHSIGGATAAAAMLADPRIRAGADMDGSLYGPVAHRGLTRPFMLITSSLPRLDFRYDPSMRPFYAHLRGPRAGLELAGSAHLTFTDVAVFKPQLPQSAAARIGQTGSIDPVAAEQTVTRYLAAFFDHYLSGQPEPLLAGTGGPALAIIGATHHGVHPAVTPATIWWRSRGALLALALVLAGSGLLGWAARPARAAGHKEAHVSGHS